MQPKTKQKVNCMQFKEQHSYFGQPDQHNNQKNIGTIKETKTKSTLIGRDMIVNLPSFSPLSSNNFLT